MTTKHNKKRNTAFLYEALVRELTKSVMNKDTQRQKTIVEVIKEHFKKGSLLYREKSLYDAFLDTTGLDEITAEKLVKEAKVVHAKIDKKELFKEQSRLIEAINRNLTQEVYRNFIPNYKTLASIAQIFNEEIPVKNRVLLEQKMLQTLTSTPEKKEKEQLKPIDNIVYKTFIKKFNGEYGNSLSESQRELMSHYVMSKDDDQMELKLYLNEELGRLKEKVKKAVLKEEIYTDEIMKKQVEKVSSIIESFKQTPVDQGMIKKVMEIQALTDELEAEDDGN